MISLGIDGGLSGGLALIESGERRRVIFACSVPTMGEDAKKRVNVVAVLAVLQRHKIDHAFIERAQAMPDQGASSGFHYGRAVGALEASVMGMQIPLTIVEASAWKRHHGLIKPSDLSSDEWRKIAKKQSRARAIMLYPESPFWPLVGDHNVAEAALIGDYGLSILEGTAHRAGERKKPNKNGQLRLGV